MSDAINEVRETHLDIAEELHGEKFKVCDELTQAWENGWVIEVRPIKGGGPVLRYVTEKHLEACIPVGTLSVQRIIATFYRWYE